MRVNLQRKIKNLHTNLFLSSWRPSSSLRSPHPSLTFCVAFIMRSWATSVSMELVDSLLMLARRPRGASAGRKSPEEGTSWMRISVVISAQDKIMILGGGGEDGVWCLRKRKDDWPDALRPCERRPTPRHQRRWRRWARSRRSKSSPKLRRPDCATPWKGN